MPDQPSPPPQQQAQPQLSYVDRPEISETFVDSLARAWFDPLHNLRMEFVVNRLDDANPPSPMTGKSVTACRIVIPAPGLVDLYAKLGALISVLQQQGIVRTFVQPPTSGRPN
jgi:hypothetical protein